MSIDPIAIGTIAAAVGGLLGAWFVHRQGREQRRARESSDIQALVSKEVDAKVGTSLMSLRSLEEEARRRFEDVSRAERDMSDSVAAKQATLEEIVVKASQQGQAIEELIERATDLIPALESAEAVPIQLLGQAHSAGDPATRTAVLLRILDHEESDGQILELAGDFAHQELSNDSLAERLYRQAVTVDPARLTARAEYLSLKANRPSEREDAKVELVQLATENPGDYTIVNAMLNFFIRTRDFQGLLDAASELLDRTPSPANLWRNIAVARGELKRPAAEVREAYENALTLGDEGDFVNAARPYVHYLINTKEFEHAAEVLGKAMEYRAGEAELHYLHGELHRKQGRLDLAVASYQLCAQIGDAADQILARRRLRDLEILKQVNRIAAADGAGEDGPPV